MIDRVELVFVDQPLKVGKLERNHAVRSKKMRHPRGEVIEVGDLRQHIVADDEVGRPPFGYESLRKPQAKEFDKCRNILLARHCGNIGGWFDAGHGNAQRQKVLKQISVVARDFDTPDFSGQDEAVPQSFRNIGARARPKMSNTMKNRRIL